MYNNVSFADFKKDYPDELEQLKEALFNCMEGNDPKVLKTEFPHNKRK